MSSKAFYMVGWKVKHEKKGGDGPGTIKLYLQATDCSVHTGAVHAGLPVRCQVRE
jgi:hypothetical protein